MVDSTNKSFRSNVKSKFSSQAVKESVKPKELTTTCSPYVSFLFSPILVKSAKKINEISKYFKKQQLTNNRKKSYAQISANQSNSTNVVRETLKIKETFPNFQNKKIKIVLKIISGQNKPKLRFNMTTKDLSCKQVIVSMKNINTNSFIKDLSIHVFNISRTLKNIKSSTMVDYICINSKGIIITTNNITILLDLQAIKKYIKSMLTIDVD